MTSPLINNSDSIKRKWLKKATSDENKYNKGYQRNVEEWTGEVLADYRGGEDTGNDPEPLLNPEDFDESLLEPNVDDNEPY